MKTKRLVSFGATLFSLLSLPAPAAAPGVHARASAPPESSGPPSDGKACSFEGLTGNCDAFDPKKVGTKIQVTSDTAIPNFAALKNSREKESMKGSKKRGSEKTAAIEKTVLEAKEKIWQALASIPDTKLSLKAKLHFLTTDGAQEIFEGYLLKNLYDPRKEGTEKVFLPWPVGDPAAEVKQLTLKEARDVLLPILAPQQEELKKAIAKLDSRENLIWDDSANEKERELTTVTPQRKQKVAALVEKAKTLLMDTIQKGRPLSVLTPEERAAVQKIVTIQLRPPEDKFVKGHIACAGFIPNAWYAPDDHTINICSGFYNFPDATIMGVIGHELTHSVDPCLGQFGLHEVDKDKLKALEREAESNPEVEKTVHLTGGRLMLGLLRNTYDQRLGDKVYTAFPFTLVAHPSAIDLFVKKGVLKPQSADIPFGQYVLRDTYACLKSKEGGGFYSPTKAEIEAMAERVVERKAREMVGENAARFDKKAEKERIVKSFVKYPECLGSGNQHSQMGEAMADWSGAEVLGKYLAQEKEHGRPLDTKEKRLATVGFFASLVCMEHFEDKTNKDSDGDIIGDTLRTEFKLRDPHPGSKDRIDNIFLRNPAIRSAMDCGPSPKPACSHEPMPKAVATQP